MNIWITGSTGFIGSAVARFFENSGDEVCRLVRGPSSHQRDIAWNPQTGSLGTSPKTPDGIIHLAGMNLSSARWNTSIRESIWKSRVDSTEQLCKSLAGMDSPPSFLISASAVGYYGDNGNRVLTESDPPGDSFLSRLCIAWEAATRPAQDAGIRVVHVRLGVVLDPAGGALGQMLPFFKLGLGGRISTGTQYMSWITRNDTCRAIRHLADNNVHFGPFNLCTPDPLPNKEFVNTLSRVLRRPAVFPVPTIVGRLFLGEIFDAVMLPSIRVQPKTLLGSGFSFNHSTLEEALRFLLKYKNVQ